MTNLDIWRLTAVLVMAVGQTAFVILYFTFPWYKSFLGRALFYKGVMLAALTNLFVASVVFEFPGLDYMLLTVYSLLGVGAWWQFFAFLRVRQEGKQDRVNPHGLGRVSGNRETALTEREVDAIEVSAAADIAEAAAIETAAVAASVAEAASEAAAVEARARARAQALGVNYE